MADLLAFVRTNHMEVINLKDGRVASGAGAFTSTRLLVGDFKVADDLLKRLVKEVNTSGFIPSRPRLVIQPLEMTEGGLCMVEERVLLELGAGTGARHVKIHVGPRLTQQAALAAWLQ